MDCAQTQWLGNEEYLHNFTTEIAKRRIPISGTLALTYRCNLHCVHCYLRGKEPSKKREMGTEQVLSLIDEITAAGCLDLLITGGEPLRRRDFPKIYRHAKLNGLLVTVFSNATLISDEIIELFDDLPPLLFEITLYGATSNTYERITGLPGSFARCMRGIQDLQGAGVKLGLKTMLLTANLHEFYDMQAIAKSLGVSFRFDADIFPRIDGDSSPLRYRVPAEKVIQLEMSGKKGRKWRDYCERRKDIEIPNRLYACGAGANSFFLDPYGCIHPCQMTFGYGYDVLKLGFEHCWREFIPKIRTKKPPENYECNSCKKRIICTGCPALYLMENGEESEKSEYLCETATLRYAALTCEENEIIANECKGNANELQKKQ